jgi:Eukaryotic and archaeal DNA primase small subunit.
LKDVFLQELKQYDCDYSFLNVLGNYKERFIDECIREISVDIDERVTVDIHRLIRFPNSIHGKTGLKVVPIKYEDIYKFEPFRDALIFLKGEARISFKVKRNFPKIYMNDEEFDLNSVENKDIPLYLALYLYLGGYANIINFSI